MTTGDNKDFFANQNWIEFVKSFDLCPHALEGKTLKVGSIGTNPYVFTDFDRNVIFNEKGLPVGSNTAITETLGKIFGFEVDIQLVRPGVNFIDVLGAAFTCAGPKCAKSGYQCS